MKTLTFDQAYPRERLISTEEHLMDVWRGDMRRVYSCVSMTPDYRRVDDPVKQAELAAQNLMRSYQLPGFNIPRLIADFGPAIEPIVHSAEEADSFLPLELASTDDARRVHKLYLDVCEKLQTAPYDRLYTTTLNVQSPLSTAASLWDHTSFTAAMDNEPAAVHRFLDRVTDCLITVIESSIDAAKGKICGAPWPYIWLPTDLGVSITDDYMPLTSADKYKEFGIPYIERVSRRFGGLFLHCGGAYSHQLPNLRDSDINLLGLTFSHPYTKLSDIYKIFQDSIVLVPYAAPASNGQYPNKPAFFTDIIRSAPPEARLWFILHPEERDFMMQMTIIQSHITSHRF
ncbi:MAG: uroporphyrinogen decarboxylase family protein [Oscillospiraceae bacterium]|jgi:hypothetical protein|nr:uroporphyrinogen decarboxylase family protein [Oscillospiraceae bacterium]